MYRLSLKQRIAIRFALLTVLILSIVAVVVAPHEYKFACVLFCMLMFPAQRAPEKVMRDWAKMSGGVR